MAGSEAPNDTTYAWDHRNRLTRVTDYGLYGDPATQAVDYLYDVENRWIGRDVDLDADGQIDSQTRFAYDGNQIVMQFDRAAATTGDPADPLTLENLSHRYLWNPAAVDQLMADEHVTTPDTPGSILWSLADHLGTIRDLAAYDSSTDATTVVNHRTFDSYGNLQSQTSATVDCLFAFTGRPLDQVTGLQNNLHRWYDASTGRWMSEDPIGFEGRDGNLYAYVGNGPGNGVDPSGLTIPFIVRSVQYSGISDEYIVAAPVLTPFGICVSYTVFFDQIPDLPDNLTAVQKVVYEYQFLDQDDNIVKTITSSVIDIGKFEYTTYHGQQVLTLADIQLQTLDLYDELVDSEICKVVVYAKGDWRVSSDVRILENGTLYKVGAGGEVTYDPKRHGTDMIKSWRIDRTGDRLEHVTMPYHWTEKSLNDPVRTPIVERVRVFNSVARVVWSQNVTAIKNEDGSWSVSGRFRWDQVPGLPGTDRAKACLSFTETRTLNEFFTRHEQISKVFHYLD